MLLETPVPHQRMQSVARLLCLAILAGVGIVMLLTPSDDEDAAANAVPVEILLIQDGADCLTATDLGATECAAAMEEVAAIHNIYAPKFTDLSDCQEMHGEGGCPVAIAVAGVTVAPTPSGLFKAKIAGIALSAPGADSIPPQPVYPSADPDALQTVKGDRFKAAWGRILAPGSMRTPPDTIRLTIQR